MTLPNWNTLIHDPRVAELVRLAKEEDVGKGDMTTESIFTDPSPVRAELVARTGTVVCGLPLAQQLFRDFNAACDVQIHTREGERVGANTVLMSLSGDARGILVAERLTLNFLMRLCGVATLARRYVEALPENSTTQILDTRKTIPGWRVLDKAAVATGGGTNHRAGLFDAVMIKDNHIAAAGSIAAAVRAARTGVGQNVKIEVEVDTLAQYDEARAAKPDIILLDNFSIDMLRQAVARRSEGIALEASGGIGLTHIPEVAATGVDRISVGALTHSALPADLALDFLGPPR